ncbi:MAG: alpha/beta fold hydrolase [Vicinamibacterales bacterium]
MREYLAALALALVALVCCAADVRASGKAVTFPSIDGTSLAGEIYEASSRPAPGVVLVHMQSRNKADWKDLADDLRDAGLTALAIDLRGHGGSSGSRENLPAMVQDVKGAVQWLSARQGVRPGNIGIVGASLGANLALLAAVELPLVRAVALLSPSLDYRGLRIDAGVLRKTAGLAVWMAAGTKDPFSLRTLKELTTSGSGGREQRLVEGAVHGMALLTADREIGRALVDWLRRSLLS